MRTRTIGYWTTTGLLAFAFAAGGAFDVSGAPAVTATIAHLGYPAFFGALLGTWKLLGAAAVLAPRMPRVKEWAYAGMFFDLSSAAISHAAAGDDVGKVITPIVLLGLVVASWALRPESRMLRNAASESPTGARSLTADASLAA
jgi:hypothetical protein